MARPRGPRRTSRRTSLRLPPPDNRPKCNVCGNDATYFRNIILDEQYVIVRYCEEHKEKA
jgi:hypothetical protein